MHASSFSAGAVLLWAALLLSSSCSLFELKTELHPRGSVREDAPAGDSQVHVPGVRCTLECAYVEEDDGLVPHRGFQVTLFTSNTGSAPIRFDWQRFELIDDRESRYAMASALAWDDEQERYGPAPTELPPGAEMVLVTMFPVDRKLELQHLFRLTLRWHYSVQGDARTIRSTFDVH